MGFDVFSCWFRQSASQHRALCPVLCWGHSSGQDKPGPALTGSLSGRGGEREVGQAACTAVVDQQKQVEANEPRAGIENTGVRLVGGHLAYVRLSVTAVSRGPGQPLLAPDELVFEGRPVCTVLPALAVCLWQVLSPP